MLRPILSLAGTLLLMSGCNSSSSQSTSTPLEAPQREALAYMWLEEKLAFDLYTAFYTLYPITPFTNIPNKSEAVHIQLVEQLVAKYDIDVTDINGTLSGYDAATLDAMPSGTYALPQIQSLYDTLYAEGAQTQEDALYASCKVEVTDVNDLNTYIAASAGHDDLISTFETLRADSYNHYWAFNETLVTMGVTEGCCALGVVNGVDYCKTSEEYPDSRPH